MEDAMLDIDAFEFNPESVDVINDPHNPHPTPPSSTPNNDEDDFYSQFISDLKKWNNSSNSAPTNAAAGESHSVSACFNLYEHTRYTRDTRDTRDSRE